MQDHFSQFSNRIKQIDGTLKEIITGSVTTFLIRGVGLVLGLAFNVLIANWLGAENTGVYLLALNIIVPVSTASRFGLDNTLVRFIASSFAAKDYQSIRGVEKKSLSITLWGAVLITLIVYFGTPFLAEIFDEPKLIVPLQVMSLSIMPTALYNLYGSMLRGLKRIRDSQLVQSALSRGTLILGLLLFGQAWGVVGISWIYVGAAIFTLVVGWLMWHFATPWLRHVTGDFDTKLLLNSNIPLFFSTLIDIFISSFATFILGVYWPTAEVGIYGAALRVALLTSLFLVAVNSIAAPQFSALFYKKEFAKLERITRYSVSIITLCAIPLGFLLVFFSRQIMLMFGPEFAAGSTVLVILSLGQLVNAITGPVGHLLAMSGNERITRNLAALAASVNVAFCFWLVPQYGMIGAAISTSVGWIIQNVLAAIYVYKELGISIIKLPAFFRTNRVP